MCYYFELSADSNPSNRKALAMKPKAMVSLALGILCGVSLTLAGGALAGRALAGRVRLPLLR